jgi:hypothetical protein
LTSQPHRFAVEGASSGGYQNYFCESGWMKPVAFHISTLDVVTHALKSSGHKCRSRAEYDLLLEKIASLRGFLQGCVEHEREVLDSINWRRRP